jgi:hypothetical protein
VLIDYWLGVSDLSSGRAIAIPPMNKTELNYFGRIFGKYKFKTRDLSK